MVHSLGIVIDNKFQQLLDRRAEAKVDESDFAKKVRKDKVKVKKVKTEAMRMTLELGEESIESKELKKLKKSLIKKTDKVVKVAMKIEKKNHQEQKGRKTSLSSSNNAEQLQAIKLTDKKEKKAPKVKEEKKAKDERKAKKSKPKKDIKEREEEENCKNAGNGSQTDTTLPGHSIPVVTSQPRQRSPEVVVPGSQQRGSISEGLPGALLLPNGSPNLVGQPGQTLKASVAIVNLGCTTWGEEAKVERSFSSEGLTCPTASLALPHLQPGQEGQLNFQFTAPLKPGRYESVWHFWLDGHRFGPPLAFNISVAAVEKKGADTELLDFSNGGGQEMLSLGSSATALEMVEMGSSRKEEFACLSLPDLDGLSLDDSRSTIPLESAISSTSSSSQDNSDEEDDFEVIPLPDCFNLEVPFELIDQGENENQDVEVEVIEEVNSTHSGDNSKKALSMGSGLKTDDSGPEEEKDARKPLKEALAAVRLVEVIDPFLF